MSWLFFQCLEKYSKPQRSCFQWLENLFDLTEVATYYACII
ncbi:MAG: hypothetical protein WC047_03255 [Kiritimatiellales bacterium]